jgi:hypothetical protein
MKTLISALLVTLVTTFTPVASAMNGVEVLPQCIAAEKWFDGKKPSISEFWAGHCIGLVTGVIHTLGLVSEVETDAEWRTCFPEQDFKPEKGVRVFVKYLQSNPELLDEPAAVLAFGAITEAFPCK